MSSTLTHFTKSFSKRADITGSPEQAFHIQADRDKYLKYVLGGISAGTIAAFGTIAPNGSFQYLYAPEVHHDLGGATIRFPSDRDTPRKGSAKLTVRTYIR